MHKIFVVSMLLCLSLAAVAVPVERSRRNVVLTDGTRVTATYFGDEHHSWLLDADGYVLQPAANGKTFVRTTRRAADEQAVADRRRRAAAAPRRVGSAATAPLPTTGSPKIPVVLVEFADSTFQVADTPAGVREYYNTFCNGTADGERHAFSGNYGTIRDYFREQSNGLFTPEFVVIGPVKLPQKASYYGQDDAHGNKDILYPQFRREAIVAATEAYTGSWSDFDNKNKGQVDLIFFVFAGCGSNTSKQDYLIWPKESTASTTVDGIKFATTGCTSENRASVNDDGVVVSVRPDGIGVFCHELSHALGLPDFYDTNYEAFGMDLWSIMDYGCYAGNGFCPGGYTSYELDFVGWRELPVITESGSYTLQPLSRGGSGVKVVNGENADEYYVLENRQRDGWDRSICQRDSGMLVIHVDFSQAAWNANAVNTAANHQRMTIIAANNRYVGTTASTDAAEIIKTWSGNLYPFEGNDSLTAHSVPAATVFTSSGYMRQDINHIRMNADKSVSFHFGNDYQVGIASLTPGDGATHPAAAPAGQPQWFSLDGRRLARKPAAAGIYVCDGRKVALH